MRRLPPVFYFGQFLIIYYHVLQLKTLVGVQNALCRYLKGFKSISGLPRTHWVWFVGVGNRRGKIWSQEIAL